MIFFNKLIVDVIFSFYDLKLILTANQGIIYVVLLSQDYFWPARFKNLKSRWEKFPFFTDLNFFFLGKLNAKKAHKLLSLLKNCGSWIFLKNSGKSKTKFYVKFPWTIKCVGVALKVRVDRFPIILNPEKNFELIFGLRWKLTPKEIFWPLVIYKCTGCPGWRRRVN